ncbi:hypothetical protein BC937DRAFT_91637 [Endogone sp. FLAS-F59071]|nr:hypothetical protein BC937DRAFT_91637 [Endogone sp. FLAS-F59071]|eukprot:RUS16068.1 hypothetical protein BC937DRAFT_91637 [Endogone sp. FLAS-F59071]
MREPNFSFPAQNRASVCITSALYDRRALDCTAVLPLINSLTHLVYLTSTSPRIREILTMDGGLERLVRILKTPPTSDRRSGWKWALAFQCVVNVGVRGSEQIRTRVVEAGMVPVIITVLDNFLKALEEVKQEKEREQQQRLVLQQQQQQQQNMTTPTTTVVPPSPLSRSPSGSNTPIASRSAPTAGITTTTTTTTPPFAPTTSNAALDAILHKEEDILLSLQLLAYLSKYPQLRTTFHTAYPPHNVFQLVEKFTHRLHPPAIHYWAGVIMRNACRKDESRGGVRQCAYLACGRWERYPREFAKCRRCRKAKYCSKQCQSKAWSEGHRWWCVERPHSGAGGGSSGGDGVPSNPAAGANGGIATPTGDEHNHHHHHHNGDDGDVDMNMANLGNVRGAALMPLVPPVQVRAALMATGVTDPMTGDPADNHNLTTPNDLATAAAAVAHLSHRVSHHHHHHHRPRSIRAIGGTGRGSEADAASGMIMDMDEEMVAAAANAAASVLIP